MTKKPHVYRIVIRKLEADEDDEKPRVVIDLTGENDWTLQRRKKFYCGDCGRLNPLGASSCDRCGTLFVKVPSDEGGGRR